MLDEIIQIIQAKGSDYISEKKPAIKGFSAGAFGFSVGLTFTEETERNFGFRVKLTMLCDELMKLGKRVLILVDEVQSSTDEMRSLATTYQHLIGDKKDVAIAMAGLPDSISAVLNDDILTFLNRAQKVYLGPLPLGEISVYYSRTFAQAGKTISPKALQAAVEATRGYPYLLQLVGYYVLSFSRDSDVISASDVENAIASSKREMVDSVFSPVLKPLSARDRDFLKAMSEDTGASRIADITERLGVSQPYAQKYRRRLVEAGVISASARGEVGFAVPYLDEYLRGEWSAGGID
jgi:hypothetical protein